MEGERIRSKQDKILYDERSTKYYHRKEKMRGQAKQITILKKDNDTEIETENKILTEIHEFYSNLYNTKGHSDTQTKENLTHVKSKLNIDDTNNLNKPFTEEEIEKAIRRMKNEKSPGKDGLTKEFYSTFMDPLKSELCELFNNMKLFNSTPDSMKNAIVKLLFKKGDHRQLKNWRPVSLLNVDYKILNKVLTNRLSNYIGKIVPNEQKCGVKGRKITDAYTTLLHSEMKWAMSISSCSTKEKHSTVSTTSTF